MNIEFNGVKPYKVEGQSTDRNQTTWRLDWY